MPTAKVGSAPSTSTACASRCSRHELGVINETLEEVGAPLSAGRHDADWWGNPFARRP